MHFVREEISTLTSRTVSYFEYNWLCDITIISLLLGSGGRINELAGFFATDIDLIHGDIHALCKGNKLETISITDNTMADLKSYLDERE